MYKLFGFLKVICVFIVVANSGYIGIILINCVEVIYAGLDLYFWRKERYNVRLFILDELLTLGAFNTACFVGYNTPLLHGLLIASVYSILLIKIFYIFTAFIS